MYSNVYDNKFINIKELIDNSEFEKAYNALKSISERCSKWYYLNSLSAMNLGYYERINGFQIALSGVSYRYSASKF